MTDKQFATHLARCQRLLREYQQELRLLEAAFMEKHGFSPDESSLWVDSMNCGAFILTMADLDEEIESLKARRQNINQ